MAIDFGSLQKEDQQRIAAFLMTADKLQHSDLFKGKFSLRYIIKYEAEQGTVQERIDRPSEKDVRDAILDLRKFVANSESIFFKAICNRLYLLLDDPVARENLDSVRQGFKDSMAGLDGSATVRIGLKSSQGARPEFLKPENVLDLYLNGDYFHIDKDKATKLEVVKAMGPVAELAFLQAIGNIASCVFYLAAMIRREFALPIELQK